MNHINNLSESEDLDNFINYSILEGQSFQSKLRTRIEDLKKNNPFSDEMIELDQLKEKLDPAFAVISSYEYLINKLIKTSEKNNPLFREVFFNKNNKIDKDLYLNLYPQYLSISHYAEIFNLCGFAPSMNMEKIHQITIKRMYAYQKFQKLNTEVAIHTDEEYSLGELFTLVKNKKIQDMLSNFWQDGRQSTLEFMVAEKGGVLVSNEDRLKVFEIKTSKTNHQGKPIYHLIYLTPSFYSYEDQHLFNNQKGSYYFLNATSRKSTCLVSTEESFFRHDFSKPIGNTDDLKFKLKINIPINMFRFEVVKN